MCEFIGERHRIRHGKSGRNEYEGNNSAPATEQHRFTQRQHSRVIFPHIELVYPQLSRAAEDIQIPQMQAASRSVQNFFAGDSDTLNHATLGVLDLSSDKIAYPSSLRSRSERKNKNAAQSTCSLHLRDLDILGCTRQLRIDEFDVWENDPTVLTLRKAMLLCCWSAVVTFIFIPAGFSMAYAMTFPDELAHDWIRGWVTDMLLGMLVFESGSVFASFISGWIYVRICGKSNVSAVAH
jgi:hypothetical protein